ncbi:MAG: 1,2-phenylacetyl-CoA epoxidase subunit PaaD [Pseudomonadota bacterium]|nr:1,2-phenylacetyl-CoA epoxidase subunit PaaD [Pseudomonadota bacterium]
MKADRQTMNRAIYDIVSQIVDPELPFLTIEELGILREVRCDCAKITVTIAPTYLACPATDVIEEEIIGKLKNEASSEINVVRQFKPAWTTDWITKVGRDKMLAFGISPPESVQNSKCAPVSVAACPRCGSRENDSLSDISSTLCKSLFKCRDCMEVFEHFKCL